MLAPVGTPPESFEKLPSGEMRPECLVLPLSAGAARGNRDIGKQSLAGLSGKMSPSEDEARPSAMICNENICHEVGGNASTLGFLQQHRETTNDLLNQETHQEFLNLDSFD